MAQQLGTVIYACVSIPELVGETVADGAGVGWSLLDLSEAGRSSESSGFDLSDPV